MLLPSQRTWQQLGALGNNIRDQQQPLPGGDQVEL